MKHSTLALVIASVLSGAVLIGCDKNEDAAGADAAQQQMPPAVVNVQTVTLDTVPQVQTFSGRTTAYQTADVRPQVNGVIDEVLFREGGNVKKGQPLYRINTDNYASSVTSGQAAVQQAQANYQTAQANNANAKAELASRQASLAQAQNDLQRLQGLVSIDAISKQQYEQAQTQVRTAQAAVQSAAAAVGQTQAGIESAKAGIQTAQAGLDASNLDLNRTIVRAPLSGRTDRSSVTAGTLVSAGQADPLVTISRLDPIYVDISQSSSELLKLRQQIAEGKAQAGMNSVELVLEDGSVYPARGKLALSEAKVDESTGAVTLRAIFPNSNNILLPGMYVTARLTQRRLPMLHWYRKAP
ncbi:HlyD family efflux transporter periplasmic adaptor subunit [Psychrobacter sp. WY6]|uniref:HlyD family efflux transporter periplasmic adaptor subunit n=1 Tax=Psychrobacter sp. WY6 TaxID=2708350 RepID=UPI002023050B|nr:HlyD family efflux transporter periplasmic adaptor subunit [Psychrobacter sp. WY6]